MAGLQCPLDPHVIALLPVHTRMNLARVREIEQHVSSTGPCVHPRLNELFLHGSLDGSTPLILACEEGNFDAVTHIVKEWGVDVNAAANFYHRRWNLYLKIVATPLFVASLMGHIEIVRYLISQSSNISAITHMERNLWYGGLTPLHGALMESRPEQLYRDKCAESSLIVQLLLDAGADPSILASDGTPIWMRDFCGVDSTIALVNKGLNLKQRNREGETILHHWIQFSLCHSTYEFNITDEEREVVVKLLIDKGADLMAHDRKGFSPILTSAESEKFNILDLLLEKDNIDRRDKIDAMELAGAQLLLTANHEIHSTNSADRKKAKHYWKKALELRQEPNPINKVPLQVTSQSVVEWATLEEIQRVMQDHGVHWIQSMLVRLRIYSYKSCKAVEEFLEYAFSNNGNFFGDLDGHDAYYNRVEEPPTVIQMEDLLMVILRVIPGLEDPYGPMLLEFTKKLVAELTDYFVTFDPLSKVLRIETSLQLILLIDPDSRFKFEYGFFAVLAKLPDVLLHKDIRNYLSRTARKDDGTLLARACENQDGKTLRLMLHLGADPKAGAWFGRGNTPLHVLAEMDETSVRSAAANLLFYYGANPNQMNDQGKTAVDLWVTKNCGEEGMRSVKWNDRPDWCRDTVPKLSRLSVRTIHIHGVPFDEKDATLPPFQELPKSV